MRTKLLGLFFVLLVNGIYAQQEPIFAEYMFNTNMINPAYAGSRETLNVFTMFRKQWLGIDGAPTTSTLATDFLVNDNVGMGASLIYDKIGPSVENNLAVDFAYKINLSPTYNLRFGLKASANLLDIDYSKLNLEDNSDPLYANNINNKFSPNIGVGLYLYSDESYAGISSPNLLETKHLSKTNSDTNTYLASERVHMYLTLGHVFEFNYNLKLMATYLSKYVSGAPLQNEFSGVFLINEKFTAGFGYRIKAAVSCLAGFHVADDWFIGYAYEMPTTNLIMNTSGSHEFFLKYEFCVTCNRIGPRIF